MDLIYQVNIKINWDKLNAYNGELDYRAGAVSMKQEQHAI